VPQVIAALIDYFPFIAALARSAYFERVLYSSSWYTSAGLRALAALSSISWDAAIKRLPFLKSKSWAEGRAFGFELGMMTSLYFVECHKYRHSATISIRSFGATETIYDKQAIRLGGCGVRTPGRTGFIARRRHTLSSEQVFVLTQG
jgi:hypothetical protein